MRMISSLFGKTPSLAKKLAILYAIVSFTVLLIASGILYWSVSEHLQHEHRRLLTAKIAELRQYFLSSNEFGTRLHDLIDVQHHHSQMPHSSAVHPGVPHHVFVRLLDRDNELLLQSDIMPPSSKPLTFPTIEDGDHDSIEISVAKTLNQLFLLGTARARTFAGEETMPLLIQVMLPLQPDETLLDQFRTTLAIVLLLGVLASAATGFWVARRGLRPLREMTAAVQKINAEKLHQRVSANRWPSEIALLAQAFDDMLARLDTSFARLSQFSADLAHELRTPVNNIMGETEVALSRPRQADEYLQVMASNMEECARLARMIDELLFLAKAENPQTRINIETVELAEEFAKIQDYYSGIAEDKGLSIACDAHGLSVQADRDLLRRVLSNLLANACRYSGEDQAIEIAARSDGQDHVVVSVTDHGEGIAADQLPFIFERFFRADRSRHHENQGTGLGLAIVKSIMELHGGSVTVSSRIHQGTRVELQFPTKTPK